MASQQLSPRQRMINLMYIVLTAMLALNVSSDVLDGFNKVHQGVSKSNDIIMRQNGNTLGRLEELSRQNPEKALGTYLNARYVAEGADSLFATIDSLKWLIALEADGKNGDPENLKGAEDLEAAAMVMLNPLQSNGRKLRDEIESYRELLTEILFPDTLRIREIESILATDNISGDDMSVLSWEYAKFNNQPAIAAITLLSQIQNDVRVAEGETLRQLLNSVDASDVRVNKMQAFVIPRSQIVMQGAEYSAQIVLAAVDSTDRPIISVNGRELSYGDNTYRETARSTGHQTYNGTLTLHSNGVDTQFPFSASYNVIEPVATISPTMMNVLYAGINNPLSISVPGIPVSDITATASNATISRSGNSWIVKPSTASGTVDITVSATVDGKTTKVADHSFKIRRLPDPSPYLSYKDAQDNTVVYKGGRPIPRSILASISGPQASIDDGILDIAFNIVSFETVFFDSMGNAMIELSDGSHFSQRQRDSIRRLQRGKRFYISKIKAVGPDGAQRDLPPLEVIVN